MNKIPYVEIRSKDTRKIIGLIEGAEIFFEYNFNGCGEFEIYCRATEKNLALLQIGNFVTLPNEVDYVDENGNQYRNIWRINKIQRQNNRSNGRYLIATGQEAKCIIGQRIIRYMSVLSGNLVDAVKSLFLANIIQEGELHPSDEKRIISELVFMPSSVERVIADENGNTTDEDGKPVETQVTYDNLLDYTEGLYATYNCGARLRLNLNNLTLCYFIYEGKNRSNSIVFSQGNENLLSSDYSEDWANYKTYALIGGEDEEIIQRDENGNAILDAEGNTVKLNKQKVNSIDDGSKGVNRYEVYIDATSLSSAYTGVNEQGVEIEKTMSDAEYKALLKTKGKETLASEYKKEVMFNGEIDTTNQRYKFNIQYGSGDLVAIRDNDIGKTAVVQVDKFTRVQNSGEGYKEYFEHSEKYILGDEEEVEGALLTEQEENLLTEANEYLVVESYDAATFNLTSTETTSVSNGVKISELPFVSDVNEDCCMPIVSEYETKKISYGKLKERLNNDLDFATKSYVDEHSGSSLDGLNLKANVDASNLTDENVESWKTKLNISNPYYELKPTADTSTLTITKDFPKGVYEIFITAKGTSGSDTRLYVNGDTTAKCRDSVLSNYNNTAPTCGTNSGYAGSAIGILNTNYSVFNSKLIVDDNEVMIITENICMDAGGTQYSRRIISSVPSTGAVTSLLIACASTVSFIASETKLTIFKTS